MNNSIQNNKRGFIDWYGKPIVLASRSPRRVEILKLIKLNFTVHPSDYHEKDSPECSPAEIVRRHAFHKSQQVAAYYRDSWIIGADTIVVKEGKQFGKPAGELAARKMLRQLSAATHQVLTGYCIMNAANGKYLQGHDVTDVTFEKLTPAMLDYYLTHENYQDKAGSYAIQDFSALFVKGIQGCFYNVVGFPLAAFYQHIIKKLHTCR